MRFIPSSLLTLGLLVLLQLSLLNFTQAELLSSPSTSTSRENSSDVSPVLTDFVENQVNLVGNADQVEQLVNQFNNLERLERITLTESSASPLSSYLYEITDMTPVESMMISITAQAARSALAVAPEANYLIASSGWRGLGSPSMTPTLNVPAEYFASQWVWQDEGIELFDEAGSATTQGYQGSGIPVALFDNSPFFDLGVSEQPVQQILSKPNGDSWQLSVWHLTEPLQSVRGRAFVPGHGYSAASLINQIAPDAQLHLFRVFNEYGIGDLFTLNQALATFIAQHEAPGVINLSLGVLADPESVPELRALEILLQEAHDKGFVIVGAAGNWSSIAENGERLIGAEQYPAKFPFVLSVGGNNSARERSCFSSETTGVSAPAGDWNDSLMSCDIPPTSLDYFTQNKTQYIVGLDPTSEETGASAWTGTSFATPLASGLAALLLQKGEQREGITPDGVIDAIKEGVIEVNDRDLGAGIINIPKSLSLIPGGGPIYRYYMPLLLAEE